jgi:hypothetical protein
MAAYIKQLSNPDQVSLQPPTGLQEVSAASTALLNCKLTLLQQSRSIPPRHTACDDSLIDRPLCETTRSPSPLPQERNVREDLDQAIPVYPTIRDGDVEFARLVQQPGLKRQALEDITDEPDDQAEKRRRTNGEV